MATSSMASGATPDVFKDITFQYILRIGSRPNEISIVLVGHLLLEYLMNTIIEAKCKSPQRITRDSRHYPFSVKLQIIHSMGLLPDHIYMNISKLNRIRNRLAHDLDFDEAEVDMVFFASSGERTTLRPKRRRNPRAFYFKMLALGTLTQLRYHMVVDLRIPLEATELEFPWCLGRSHKSVAMRYSHEIQGHGPQIRR